MNTVSKEKLPSFNPYVALVSGVLAVSTGAIFVRLADAPTLVIAAYRLGLATLILVPIAWWKGREDLKRLGQRDIKLALLSGLFLFTFANTFFNSEIKSLVSGPSKILQIKAPSACKWFLHRANACWHSSSDLA